MEPTTQPQPTTAAAPRGIKQQIAEDLKNAGSIVVTTSKQPSLDEVAAVVGLTQLLQAMGKHATGVISTALPKAAEFLNPRAVIQADTKRLQDFVISLHKDKVDKLRYKLDGDEVKVFMTPYRTVLTENDLSFSQGDYNIDTVVALGVVNRNEIDDAMLVSPRILADPSVITITKGEVTGTLGKLNWNDSEAISLTEMVANLSEELGNGLLKSDSSQSLLTGLVAVTDQFGNQLTSPKVMTMAAQLMNAGADQQLIVKNLKEANALKVIKEPAPQEDEPAEQPEAPSKKAQSKTNTEQPESTPTKTTSKPEASDSKDTVAEIEDAQPKKQEEAKPEAKDASEPHVDVHPKLPTLKSLADKPAAAAPVKAELQQPTQEQKDDAEDLASARTAVKQASDSQAPKNPEPIQSLNAQNIDSTDSNDIVINHDGEVHLPQ